MRKINFNVTEKQIVWTLLILIVISTIVDLYTAVSSPIFEIAEANPLYVYTGSITLTVMAGIVVVFFIFRRFLNAVSLPTIFGYTLICLYIIGGHAFGTWTNISATSTYYENPEETIQKIEAVSDGVRVQSYGLLMLILFVPVVIAVVAFTVSYKIFLLRRPKREQLLAEVVKLVNKIERG